MRSKILWLLTLSFSLTQYGLASDVAKFSPNEEKELKRWNDKIVECDKYNGMCSGAVDHMAQLSDGTSVRIYKKPKPEIMQVFTALKKHVWQYADQMGVDPRAVIAGILAENSINSDVTNSAKNFLTRHSIFSAIAQNGKILGSYRSVGWGLIHCDTAYNAEVYVAELQNRKPMEMNELCSWISSEDHPEGAIYAAAVIARQAQELYKKQGFDIGSKPEIMATLYNLGQPAQRAAAAKAANRAPRPNWFGVFTERYLPQIEQAIGYSDYLASKNPASNSKKAGADKSRETASAAGTELEKALKIPKGSQQRMLTADLKLLDSPGSCVQRSQQNAVGEVKKGTQFDTVASSIDCDGTPWDMVQTRDGTRGWIKRTILSQNYEIKAGSAPCKPNLKGSKCVVQLKDLTKDHSGSLKDLNYELNFYASEESCKAPRTSNSKSNVKAEALTSSDATELSAMLSRYRSSYGSPNAAVAAVITPDRANSMIKMLNICQRVPCQGPVSELKRVFSLPADKGLSSKDLVFLNDMPEIQLQDEKGIRDRYLKALAPCQTLTKGLADGKQSNEFIQSLMKDISTEPIWSNLFSTCAEFYDHLGNRCSTILSAASSSSSSTVQGGGSKPCESAQSATSPMKDSNVDSLTGLLGQLRRSDLDNTYNSTLTDLVIQQQQAMNGMGMAGGMMGTGMYGGTPSGRPSSSGRPSGTPTGMPSVLPTEEPQPQANSNSPSMPWGYLLSVNLSNEPAPASCSGSKVGDLFRKNVYQDLYSTGGRAASTDDLQKQSAQALQAFKNSSSKDKDVMTLLMGSLQMVPYAPSKYVEDFKKKYNSRYSGYGNPYGAQSANPGSAAEGKDSKSPQSSCAENNQDAMDMIEDVLKLPCVNQVYISNFYLYDLAKSNGIKAVYRPMKETDKAPRLMFDLKMSEGKCAP